MANKIVGVLGLGIFGQTVAVELARYGTEVIAMMQKQKKMCRKLQKVTNAVIGDFTDIDILYKLGLQNCDIINVTSRTNLGFSLSYYALQENEYS